MTLAEKIYAILSAGTTATFVPANRIKVPGPWQDVALPYIVHRRIAVETTHTHDGLESLRKCGYEVSVYASDYSSACDIEASVIADLDGYIDADVQAIDYDTTVSIPDFDTDRNVQHFAVQFTIGGGLQ